MVRSRVWSCISMQSSEFSFLVKSGQASCFLCEHVSDDSTSGVHRFVAGIAKLSRPWHGNVISNVCPTHTQFEKLQEDDLRTFEFII